MEDFEQIYRLIADDCADPAQRARHAHLIQKLAPSLVEALMIRRVATISQAPFPRRETIRAAQCAIFDNFLDAPIFDKNGRKKRPPRRSRYGIAIDVWTVDPDKVKLTKLNRAFTATGALMNAKELHNRLIELENPSKCQRPFIEQYSDDEEGRALANYAAFLRTVSTAQPAFDFAPLFTKGIGEGTFYHCDTLALINRADIGTGDIHISAPAGTMAFTGFKATDSSGNRLKGRCIAQSRITTSPSYSSVWKADLI